MKLRHRLLLCLLPAVLSAPAFAAQEPRVDIETSLGHIVVQLSPSRAPVTVRNFLTYVKEGFYSGTVFHRVISGFMIQGGGYDASLKEKPTHAPIPLESKNGLRNEKYSIAMARTNDPNSATSQFYINVADNDFLNADRARDGRGYAVFGRVVKGTDVVDRIAEVKTGAKRGMSDVPVEPVTIISAKIVD